MGPGEVAYWPISEVAARLIKVGSMGLSGLDLLKLGFSHFDPQRKSGAGRIPTTPWSFPS